MKFSVIIINYNYANYVAEAIQSAFSQTWAGTEIIVVDDGSTDHSVDVISSIQESHPELKLASQSNQGQLAAIRKGTELATGDWFFYLDADDTWLPNHLSNAAEIISKHPDITLYYSNHTESHGDPIFRSKWPEGKFGPCGGLVAARGTRTGTITSALALRRDEAYSALFFACDIDAQWKMRAEDCLIFGASLHGAIIYYDARLSMIYRIHGQNAFANVDPTTQKAIYDASKAQLFSIWMKNFGLHQEALAEQVLRDFCVLKENRSNWVLQRRFASVLMRLEGTKKDKAMRLIRLLKLKLLG
jgi:glycosyltransferase involved in cell wall biosynthesis